MAIAAIYIIETVLKELRQLEMVAALAIPLTHKAEPRILVVSAPHDASLGVC